jgi:cytochrome c biogenesis protein CcdA/glutaredoxin
MHRSRHRGRGRGIAALAPAAVLSFLASAVVAAPVRAQQPEEAIPDIVVFTHITCPHCTDAKEYLADLQRREPGLRIWIREISEDPRAAGDLREVGRAAGVPSPGVPAWVIGGQVFMVGFGSAATTGRQIEQLLQELELPAVVAATPGGVAERPAGPGQAGQPPPDPPAAPAAPTERDPATPAIPAPPATSADPATRATAAAPGQAGEPAPEGQGGADGATAEPAVAGEGLAAGDAETARAGPEAPRLRTPGPATLTLPFFGEVDAAAMSLPALTGLIAFVDGFNPCSLWVLTFLLGIVLYSGSRRKVLLVGSLFLLVTASAYGLFIVGMFGTLRYLAYLSWITFLVAGLALAFALVNIKDYFWFQQGVSLTISDRHKPKIFERTRNLMHPGRSLPALLVGTVVLALGITLVELPCTAGFPMVWSGIVAQQNLSLAYFATLLALYLTVYLLIELVIFGSVVVTMKRSRFEERHGRILKLVGGMIMLALAVTLVVAPETMHSLAGTLLIFGGAVAASLVILWLHRRVLPRFGIVIGSENLPLPASADSAVKPAAE